MTTAGTCPHPEKRSWPVRDAPGGLACTCGHSWEPYIFIGVANRFFHHDRRAEGDAARLEVYRCRDRFTRAPLDHVHTTDRAKRDRRHPQDRYVDAPVKGGVSSTQDIQKPRWNGRRKPRPTSRTERRRLKRHRRI